MAAQVRRKLGAGQPGEPRRERRLASVRCAWDTGHKGGGGEQSKGAERAWKCKEE